MARFVDAIDLPLPIEQAFDDLADFSHIAEWDPGVAEARQLDDGQVRLGAISARGLRETVARRSAA
jgi:hypothetical protein